MATERVHEGRRYRAPTFDEINVGRVAHWRWKDGSTGTVLIVSKRVLLDGRVRVGVGTEVVSLEDFFDRASVLVSGRPIGTDVGPAEPTSYAGKFLAYDIDEFLRTLAGHVKTNAGAAGKLQKFHWAYVPAWAEQRISNVWRLAWVTHEGLHQAVDLAHCEESMSISTLHGYLTQPSGGELAAALLRQAGKSTVQDALDQIIKDQIPF